MPDSDNPFDFVIDGVLCKNADPEGEFTPAEAREVMMEIIEFFEERGWSFGGAIGTTTMTTNEPVEDAT